MHVLFIIFTILQLILSDVYADEIKGSEIINFCMLKYLPNRKNDLTKCINNIQWKFASFTNLQIGSALL